MVIERKLYFYKYKRILIKCRVRECNYRKIKRKKESNTEKEEKYRKGRMNMDRIDEHLIYLLQKNARMSLKDLAKEVYLSTPAVSARIEKMEKEGIIKGYGVKIDPLKLGFHITAFINMELEPVQKPEFYPFIESIPNVIECNCVTGNYSMLMKVAFPSTIELDGFIGQLQYFGKTQTQIVFSTPVEPRGLNVEALEEKEE